MSIGVCALFQFLSKQIFQEINRLYWRDWLKNLSVMRDLIETNSVMCDRYLSLHHVNIASPGMEYNTRSCNTYFMTT